MVTLEYNCSNKKKKYRPANFQKKTFKKELLIAPINNWLKVKNLNKTHSFSN